MKSAEKLYGLLGHPVGHSLSPVMQNDQFAEQGLPSFYHAFNVPPEHLKDAVQGLKALDISGFNVTVPHKIEVMEYLDEIDEEARIIGAVNTVVKQKDKWVGYNTDGRGYVESLLSKTGDTLKESNVLVIGAGGAARAVVTALSFQGVRHLTITNRTYSKAETLREQVPQNSNITVLTTEEAEKENPTFDIIINTTSIGMSPDTDKTPWRTDNMKPNCLCSDLIYNPLKTKWLKEAERHGADTLNGVGMFVGQGAFAFYTWTGVWPDLQRMNDVVMQHLGGK
ncbi:shikimate dehydrogenase [Salibacterium salarium]|uniref:Shikimate dehydrogenase (NADP(+)) n=1 Tax=Salibacterium salarium TaxID=284579 RepID=A0A428MZU9_9BACI|nr:shikimate dehydrogenase [Salibacterium salarium]RSL31549.1 shikimate dehydrogenase [Salibacterium salarium]